MLKKVENNSDCPKCFGDKSKCKDEKCVYNDSCELVHKWVDNYGKESEWQIRAEDVHKNIENIEYDQEIGDKNQENLKDEVLDTIEPPPVSESQIFGYRNSKGEFIEVDLTSLPAEFVEFWTLWVIENKRSALALMKKMFGECRNISEVADKMGISRQAMSLSLANELGVGKKKIPETKILGKCTPRERDVYECIVMRGLSQRQTAKELNIHYRQVLRCLHYLRRKKIEVSALKNDKTQK